MVKKEVKKGKSVKKIVPKLKKEENNEEKEEGGMSLDDAFGDDDDVEYAKPKPRKEKKKKSGEDEEDIEEEIEEVEAISNGSFDRGDVEVKQSKPISKIKKGDKVKVDGKTYEVDAHYPLMDHGTTKEMAIEIFDPDADKDFQLRYFDDQVENTIEFYELQEILYVKRPFKRVEW